MKIDKTILNNYFEIKKREYRNITKIIREFEYLIDYK